MSDRVFSERLAQLEARFGQSVPKSVLQFFLQENNGNIEKCILDLERNQWIKRRHTSDVEATSMVHGYQKTNSQYKLSSSQDSPSEFRRQRQNPHPAYRPAQAGPGAGGSGNDYFGDVFTPHPPLLPNTTNTDFQINNCTQLPTEARQPFYNSQNSGNSSMVTGADISKSMPPYNPHSGHPPGYTKQLSEADKDTILRRQKESTQRAKVERESIVAELEELKIGVRARNDQLRTLKRENSSARIPNEEDVEFLKIIINTLNADIEDEEQKRRKRDWTCKFCSFLNSPVMEVCDSCNEPRPHPSKQVSSSHFNSSSSPNLRSHPQQKGYNYR